MKDDPSSKTNPASVESTEPLVGLELRSFISSQGMLELVLEQVEAGNLAENEVIVRVEATPLNPSDIGLLFGPADLSEAKNSGTDERPSMTAPVCASAISRLGSRIDKSLKVGNEGAGVVIRAGAQASDLLGKTVSMVGGGMYTQYRRIHRDACMVLDDGITSSEGAAAFVNPLTALGMVETMRREGHQALVHTAAASSLGQMLVKLCSEEGIGLVNIVRSDSQVKLLQDMGARHVLNSTSPTFEVDLVDALVQTRATLCFDALSGGSVPGIILGCMETALSHLTSDYQRYGSSIHKQIYMYGILDPRPIVLPRVGMAWGVGGWLLFDFLEKIGPEAAQKLRERVNKALRTTFAIHYKAKISLEQVLTPDVARMIAKRTTGEKYLISPFKGAIVRPSR